MKPSRRQLLLGAAAAAAAGAALPGRALAADSRLDRTLSFRQQNGGYGQSGAPGISFSTLYNLEVPPGRVRLIWFNDQPIPASVDAAAIAPTAEPGDGVNPVAGDGRPAPALWRPVTFREASPGSDPGRLSMPPNPGPPGQPLLRFSDWIDVGGLPRRDGGAGALLLVRSYSSWRLRYSAGGSPDPVTRRESRAHWAPGNAAAPPYAMADPHPLDGVNACYGLQYSAAAPVAGATVLGIGDSIMMSLATTGTTSGFGFRACAMLSTPQLPISYINEGYSGRNSTDFGVDGLRDIMLLRPQVALLQAWSAADPRTPEAARAAFDRATNIMEAARQVGCATILTTGAPAFVDHAPLEPVRALSNGWVRELGRRGVPVLDIDAIWGTGATPNGYQPRFDPGDHTHPNNAGATAAADALAPMLRRILGIA